MPEGNGNGSGAAALMIKELAEGAGLTDRGYLKEYLDKPLDKDTATALLKKLDGAESLLGKRPQVPDFKTAKPEDVLKFFEQARPEKIEEYEIKVAEGVKPDESVLKAVRQAFHDGAISKAQAQKFLASMDPFWTAQAQKAAQEKQRRDKEFETLAKAVLGDNKQAVMERAKKLFADFAPPAVKINWDKVDDNNLVAMAAVVEAIHKKYAPEDDSLSGKSGSGAGATGNTLEEKRTEMRTLMSSPAWKNWQDAGHDAALAKVKQLAEEMAKLQAV